MNDATSPLTSDDEVEWRLPRHPRSVGRSRALLREQVRAWRIPECSAQTAVLLLSELVTNACRHARVPTGRQISARCALRDGRLRIEVSDASRELPRRRDALPDEEGGRGLALVDALADAWDAQPRACGIGKTVWFELKLP